MKMDTIATKIAAYEALRSQADEMKEQLTELNKRKEAAEDEAIAAILDAMDESGADDLSVGYEGLKYSVTVKTMYAIPKASRDAAFEEMRNLGMGDLIQEKVDDRTLTKELQTVLEENGGVLPEEYDGLAECLTQYDKKTLNRRKA